MSPHRPNVWFFVGPTLPEPALRAALSARPTSRPVNGCRFQGMSVEQPARVVRYSCSATLMREA